MSAFKANPMKHILFFLLLLFGSAFGIDLDHVNPTINLAALNAEVRMPGNGYGLVGFQLAGTWSGTITFEASIDGTNWVAVQGPDQAEGGASSSTTTANGIYAVSAGVAQQVRARVSIYASGIVEVTAVASTDLAVSGSGGSGGGGAEGSVDVLSIAAGNNNIGNMDVVTLPADPLGANADSASASGSISAKLRQIATNGHPVTNAGTFATQVDGAALTALELVDNLVLAEDAAHSNGDPGVQGLAVRRDANTTLAASDGDYGPLQLNADGSLKVAITAGAGSGGTSATDDAAFTPGSGAGTPAMGMYDNVSSDPVDEGDVGVIRMSRHRAAIVTLYDTAGVPLSVGAQYAEDAAHASGDQLMMAGGVRRDTPASSATTDGDNATLNLSSSGRLWTSTTVDAALPAGTNAIGTVTAVGAAAHDAAISGNPVRVGARAMSADVTAVASGDAVDLVASLLGKLVNLPYALPGLTWRYAAPAAGLVNTTGVTAKAAAGAGFRNYITGVQCVNSHQTTGTEVEIRDGAAGTVIWRGWAQAAGGGFATQLPVPLRGTANTLVEIAEVTTTATAGVLCNLQGYEAAE